MDSYFSYTYFPFIVLAFRYLSSLPPSFRTHGLRRAKENSFLAFHRGTEENSARGYAECFDFFRRTADRPTPRLPPSILRRDKTAGQVTRKVGRFGKPRITGMWFVNACFF